MIALRAISSAMNSRDKKVRNDRGSIKPFKGGGLLVALRFLGVCDLILFLADLNVKVGDHLGEV